MSDTQFLHQPGLCGLTEFQRERLAAVQDQGSPQFQRPHQRICQRHRSCISANVGAGAGLIEVDFCLRDSRRVEGTPLQVKGCKVNASLLQCRKKRLLPFGVLVEDNQIMRHEVCSNCLNPDSSLWQKWRGPRCVRHGVQHNKAGVALESRMCRRNRRAAHGTFATACQPGNWSGHQHGSAARDAAFQATLQFHPRSLQARLRSHDRDSQVACHFVDRQFVQIPQYQYVAK